MTTRLVLICLALITLTNYSFSTSTTAINNGDWNQHTTWSNGVPGCVDTVVIPANMQVNVTSNINIGACSQTSVILHGIMHFGQGSEIKMSCDSYVLIMSGGAVQANNYSNNGKKIKICNSTVWQGKDGEVTGPAGLGNSPLPIELVLFEANYNSTEDAVIIDWLTASESNNDYFTIERSVDGINWEAINTVKGAGTSSVTQEYEIIDRSNSSAVSYYRLKQTDFDGHFTYSMTINVKRTMNEISIYPNPAQTGTDVIIQSDEAFKATDIVELYNASGNLVKRMNSEELEYNQNFVLNTNLLNKGVYFLRINEETQKIVLK